MDLPPPISPPFSQLPESLDVGTDPADGWTQVVYDDHMIANHDPVDATSLCRLHLLEEPQGYLMIDIDKLAGYLKILTRAGFRFTGMLTAPHSAGHSLRILLYEGRHVDAKKLQNAIWWTYRLSRPAIDRREL